MLQIVSCVIREIDGRPQFVSANGLFDPARAGETVYTGAMTPDTVPSSKTTVWVPAGPLTERKHMEPAEVTCVMRNVHGQPEWVNIGDLANAAEAPKEGERTLSGRMTPSIVHTGPSKSHPRVVWTPGHGTIAGRFCLALLV